MIIQTTDGLLRLDVSIDEFLALNLKPDVELDTWYCPFGTSNPDWIKRRRIYIESVQAANPVEFAEFHANSVSCGELPRIGPVLCEAWESEIWNRMKEYFYGPIAGCPGPNVKLAIAKQYAEVLMYAFTKYGDVVEGAYLPKEAPPYSA